MKQSSLNPGRTACPFLGLDTEKRKRPVFAHSTVTRLGSLGLLAFLSFPSLLAAGNTVHPGGGALNAEGALEVEARGLLGQEMHLEASDTLADPWTALQSSYADTAGWVRFTENIDGSTRFYRVQGEPMHLPLVYSVEHTRAECPPPVLPNFNDLPVIVPLTDPFAWSDGSGRIASFEEWGCRRAEIKAELEAYEIGPKPPRPEDITATYVGGLLTVNVTVNGENLTLTSQIVLPSADGPYPAIIGVGFGGTGSLPADIFNSRNIAQIPFNFGQVMAHTQTRGSEPINRLYPEMTDIGAYSAWSWGVSRLIDGLELVQDQLPIDLARLGITGCSFAGKMALWAGALDERIALTIAQEPGGGGAAAWRVSELLPGVERLGSTSRAWFMDSMFRFQGSEVSRLPMDHHELMAMIAPRAFLFLGNRDMVWLAEESGYVSARAAHEVWKAFGIGDRFGFSIVGGHNHCALPNSQRPEVEAFVDKFLLGIEEADTHVTTHPYPDVDYQRWTAWWGTENPVFPRGETVTFTLEAECGVVGAKWDILSDPEASNGRYVQVKDGFSSRTTIPDEPENLITFTFTVEKAGAYDLYMRALFPSSFSNAYWFRVNEEPFRAISGTPTTEWSWRKPPPIQLQAGTNTITFGYRFEGAQLDKILISNYPFPPDDAMGPEAINLCP